MPKLNNPFFERYSLSEIRPRGWLKNQLEIQAKGLSGNLDKIWPDVKDSAWIGGGAEGWERLPYWLDGFIPLAWQLGNEDMKSRAKKYIDEIIKRQDRDGWICPAAPEDREDYDVWAFFLILKVLTVYYDASKDERIVEVVQKGLMSLDRHIDNYPLRMWAQFRWFECLIPIAWLYEIKPQDWLLKLAAKLRNQGFDYEAYFRNAFPKEPKHEWNFHTHVVNLAMMLKSGPLFWRFNSSEEEKKSVYDMIRLLDEYHGTAVGVFTGDECLAGKSPSQGTELCAVAEYMYSLEHIYSITGDPRFGDRLEKIAFNALPAAFSPDMWTHQYVQQVNQIKAGPVKNQVYMTNGPDANMFGLEPNFGCCTANFNQAWPKFASSVFMKAADGIACTVYAPALLETNIGGTDVKVEVKTDYPFREKINFIVAADGKAEFALYLRIPSWAETAYMESDSGITLLPRGRFYRLFREWEGNVSFGLVLKMRPEFEKRPNSLYALKRGPLVYSLKIDEKWTERESDKPYKKHPHCDYEVTPRSPWNYAIYANLICPEMSIEFRECPMLQFPFSQDAPVTAKVKGKRIKWSEIGEAAAPVPDDFEPLTDDEEDLTFIPYGCTDLRMTEMPVTDDEKWY